MTIELTKKEAKILLELLSLDMDSIGYDDDEIELLDKVYDKVKSAK